MTARPKPRSVDPLAGLSPQDTIDELLRTRHQYPGRAGQVKWRSLFSEAMRDGHGVDDALPSPAGGAGVMGQPSGTPGAESWQQGRGTGSMDLTWIGGNAIQTSTGPFGHRVAVVAASGTTPASWTVQDSTGHIIQRGSSQTTAGARVAAEAATPRTAS